MRMRYIVNCGLPRSTTYFRIISQTAQLSKNILNFFLDWEMFQTEVIDKIETHVLRSVTFIF